MKTIKYILSILTISLFLTSCDWLEPETDLSNQIYQIAATLVHDNSGENVFITDDNFKLLPSNKLTIPDNQKDSLLNKRYFISFQLTEEDQVISTNKTHARGPVGLEGLTIYKYKLYGNGQTVKDYANGTKKFTHKKILHD